jgi:hypothetical protein
MKYTQYRVCFLPFAQLHLMVPKQSIYEILLSSLGT